MPVTKKVNMTVLMIVSVVLGIVIIAVGLIIYSNSLIPATLSKESVSSSVSSYSIDVNEETAKLKTCSLEDMFKNVSLTPAAQDMNFLDSMYDYVFKEEPNTPNINLNSHSAGTFEGNLFYAELYFKGFCNYPLLNYSVEPSNVLAVYYSFNEKKVYFLNYDESSQTDTKTTTLKLEGYGLEKLAIDSTNNIILPIPNENFLGKRTEGDLISELPTKYFFQDSMISVASQKIYVSISPVANCFAGEQSPCYFKDEFNVAKKLEKENLSGVYETDIKTGVSKKVYSSKLLTSDGFLTNIDVVKLVDIESDEFSIYFKDIREKVTKL